MTNTTINLIQECADTLCQKPINDNVRSYVVWAAYTLINDILDHPFEDPLDVTTRQLVDFEAGMLLAVGKPTEIIYKTAFQTILSIHMVLMNKQLEVHHEKITDNNNPAKH